MTLSGTVETTLRANGMTLGDIRSHSSARNHARRDDHRGRCNRPWKSQETGRRAPSLDVDFVTEILALTIAMPSSLARTV